MQGGVELQLQVIAAEADVVNWQERVAWTERMVKKGLMAKGQLESEQAKLQRAVVVLDVLRQALWQRTGEGREKVPPPQK